MLDGCQESGNAEMGAENQRDGSSWLLICSEDKGVFFCWVVETVESNY